VNNRTKIIEKYFATEQKLHPSTKIFFQKLRKKPPKNLDIIVHELHNEAFECIDCLGCANCCKSISPGVKDKDVDRLAKFLKMKPSEVVETYFYMDSDGDYVFKETPCPFLLPDNYCMVYEARPKACREYPHTDRRRFAQILPLTKKNISVCPAVWHIMEKLKEKIGR